MARESGSLTTGKMPFAIVAQGFFALLVLGLSTLFFSTLMIFVYWLAPDWTTITVSRIWSLSCMSAGGVRLNVHGLEKLKKGGRYVFVSNHQSALDIPIMLAVLPYRVSFMAKRSLFMIPLFGWGIFVAGHIVVDRTNPRKARLSILRAADRLKRKGRSLLIFPEGTRSPDGALQEFKRGAFALPIESGADVIPVAISNACNILPKKSMICRAGAVDVFIGDPIPTQGMQSGDKQRLLEQVRAQIAGMLGQ